jgi:hypothetical protein
MARELIERYPAADSREQIGRFLRHVFPLGLDSFAEESFVKMVNVLEDDEQERVSSRH